MAKEDKNKLYCPCRQDSRQKNKEGEAGWNPPRKNMKNYIVKIEGNKISLETKKFSFIFKIEELEENNKTHFGKACWNGDFAVYGKYGDYYFKKGEKKEEAYTGYSCFNYDGKNRISFGCGYELGIIYITINTETKEVLTSYVDNNSICFDKTTKVEIPYKWLKKDFGYVDITKFPKKQA